MIKFLTLTWNNGMVEYWNVDFKKRLVSLFHHSNVSLFQ